MPGCKVWIDTQRSETHESCMFAHADVQIEGEDVRLEVLTFKGSDAAFEKMEKVLSGLGFFGEKVRVH